MEVIRSSEMLITTYQITRRHNHEASYIFTAERTTNLWHYSHKLRILLRSEVLTVVKMSTAIFWVVTPCTLEDDYQRPSEILVTTYKTTGVTTQNTILDIFLLPHCLLNRLGCNRYNRVQQNRKELGKIKQNKAECNRTVIQWKRI
jgi:hypothetical protein